MIEETHQVMLMQIGSQDEMLLQVSLLEEKMKAAVVLDRKKAAEGRTEEIVSQLETKSEEHSERVRRNELEALAKIKEQQQRLKVGKQFYPFLQSRRHSGEAKYCLAEF